MEELLSFEPSVLGILKIAGLLVGFATTLWGLTQKITYEDSDGNKRLTPAGHIAVALAAGAFLISASSFGFQTLDDRARAREAQLKALTRAAQEAAAEARAVRTEQMQRTTLANTNLIRLESLAGRAEARATSAEARLLALQASAQSRMRDLVISRQVNSGTQRNLAKAEQALGEIGRLLQPLGSIEVEIRVSAGTDGLQSPALDQLKALLARFEADPDYHDPTSGASFGPIGARRGVTKWVSVNDGSPAFPRSGDPIARHLMGGPVATLTRDASQRARDNEEYMQMGLPLSGDLRFAVNSNESSLELDSAGRLTYTMTSEIPEARMERSGEIASVRDLEEVNLILHWPFTDSRLPPIELEELGITIGGRTYRYGKGDVRVVRSGEDVYFIVPRMGAPL